MRSGPFLFAFAANFAQATSFSLFLHFPGFLQQVGADEPAIGWVLAAGAVAAILVSPVVGKMLDTHGRRQVIWLGNALMIALCACYFLFDSITLWLVVVVMAHYAVGTMLHAGFFTYAADIIPVENRAQGLAIFGISAMASIGAGAILGDIAFLIGGYDGIFLFAVILAVLAAVLSLHIRETLRPVEKGSETVGSSWFGVLLDRELSGVWIMSAAFFFSMSGVFIYLKTWVLATGIGSIGLYFGFYATTAILLRVFFGSLPDRVGAARLVAPVILVYALGFAMLAFAGSVEALIFAAVLGGVGHGFGYPVLLALATARAGPASTGKAVSIYGAVDDGAVLVAAPVLGILIEDHGYAPMYVAISGLLIATALGFRLRDAKRGF